MKYILVRGSCVLFSKHEHGSGRRDTLLVLQQMDSSGYSLNQPLTLMETLYWRTAVRLKCLLINQPMDQWTLMLGDWWGLLTA